MFRFSKPPATLCASQALQVPCAHTHGCTHSGSKQEDRQGHAGKDRSVARTLSRSSHLLGGSAVPAGTGNPHKAENMGPLAQPLELGSPSEGLTQHSLFVEGCGRRAPPASPKLCPPLFCPRSQAALRPKGTGQGQFSRSCRSKGWRILCCSGQATQNA